MRAWAVVAAIVAVAYFTAFPVYTFRYRLTVEVESDGVVKSGSSVIQVRWIALPPIIPMGITKDYETSMHGEAIVIDLSPKPMLVVGLYGDSDPSRSKTSKSAYDLFLVAHGLKADRSGLSTVSSLRQKVDVPVSLLPELLILPDLNDPKTVQVVTPESGTNELSNGYRLRAATAQITDAPVTHGIRDKLPWLKGMPPGTVVRIVDRGNGRQAIYSSTFVED